MSHLKRIGLEQQLFEIAMPWKSHFITVYMLCNREVG